ncbi:HAD-IB family phosphatase [Lusitaniella coriacea]|uniref:HAD-IB family phosphatase n=1 Tax=Lusitaniella coriacea TaxID=1983105 RepID=UPI003CF1F3A2
MSSPAKVKSNPYTIFCDFDGTITAVETFAGMLKAFAPELSAKIMPELYARRLTLREGVRQMLESIPSERYPEMIAFADDKPTRSGLRELLEDCQKWEIPFVVVSGGLRDMVERVLRRSEGGESPLIERVSAIAAVEVETSSGNLRVPSQDFEGETELMGKVRVMAQYPAQTRIAIGDSLTDINMALEAEIVFARDRLQDYLEGEGKPYIPWNDFFNIRDRVQQIIAS